MIYDTSNRIYFKGTWIYCRAWMRDMFGEGQWKYGTLCCMCTCHENEYFPDRTNKWEPVDEFKVFQAKPATCKDYWQK